MEPPEIVSLKAIRSFSESMAMVLHLSELNCRERTREKCIPKDLAKWAIVQNNGKGDRAPGENHRGT